MRVHKPTLNQFAFLLALNVTNTAFQLLVILLLVQFADTEKLGAYFIALSFSVLLSILVNFGTTQTGLISLKKAEGENERKKISAEILGLRTLPFLVSALICLIAPMLSKSFGTYFLLTLPMIFAEFINPQAYLIATYKSKNYTILNFLLKAFVLISIYVFKTDLNIIEFTILATGSCMTILNLIYLPSSLLQKGTLFFYPKLNKIISLTSENVLIMGNGITGQLQQSLFLFALPSIASPLFVSSYGFIDKLISSFRMLINAYGTAFMPRAAGLHKEGFDQWKMIKQQQNTILTIGCVLIALIMFIFPHQLLMLLFMGKKTEAAFFTQTAILIQAISMVPLLIALNVLNVAEVFLEKKYTLHFKGGLLLLLITVISITALKYTLPFFVAGYYPMIIEGASLIVSLSIVQKIRNAQP